MKRKIMITLDGSSLSENALPVVQNLFPAQEIEIILVHVIDPLTYSPYVTPMAPSLTWDPQLIEHEWVEHRRVIVDEMNVAAHKLEQQGFHVRVHIPVGDPIHEICEIARTEQVDLLAMATHGRSGIMRLLLGSVAEGVLRSLSLPMLLIRPQEVQIPEKEYSINPQHLKTRKSEVVYETPSV